MSIRSYSVLMTIWLVSSATGQTAVPGTMEITPVQNIFELEELFVEQQYNFLPIAPPSEEIYLHSSSQVVPVLFDNFPKKFQNRIMAEFNESTGIPLYPITMVEDPVSRRTIFRNAFGVVIYQLEPEENYNPLAWQEWKFDLSVGESLDPFTQWLYDPAHIAVSFTLIDSIYYESYLAEKEAQRLASEMMQPMAMAMSAPLTKPIASMTTGSNGLVTLDISLPDTFGGYVEIFDRDWLQQWDDWELAKSWLPTYGNAQVGWEDSASSGKNHRFYYIGDATDDPDGDGYSTLREELVTETDPTIFNTMDMDNDGMHDWWETKIFGGTGQNGSQDYDGDGLLNNEEMVYVSSGYGSPSVTMTSDPSLFDTDADGMDDGFEESYYWLDPMDSSDGENDRDGDNLTNLEEYQIGTLPDEEDTDGDGLDDWGEFTFGLDPTVPFPSELTTDSDGDLMPNGYEIDNFLNPWDASDKHEDKDRDGLENYWEYTNNLAAGNWDTDGDTLPDGTEVEWGTQPDIADDLNSDTDGDGLTLGEEYENVTNPNLGDSDSDGTNDGDEVDQGSDPADGSDGGTAPPEDDQVELTLTIGDDSGSHSEIYEMVVSGSPSKRLPSGGYGETATETYTFKRGESYTITLIHRGTDPSWLEDHDEADYDYVAKVEEAGGAQAAAMLIEMEEEDWIPGDPGEPPMQMVAMAATSSSGSGVVIIDSLGILGTHRESTSFFASGKSVEAHIIKVTTETVATTPANLSRKTIGVGEEVKLTVEPSVLSPISWSVSGSGAFDSPTGNPVYFTAHERSSTPTITASYNSQGYDFSFTVVEPNGIDAWHNIPNTQEYGVGDAGAGMGIAIKVVPSNVSFYNVRIMEVGMVSTDATGYFTNTSVWPASYLDHSQHGANNPADIQEDNHIGQAGYVSDFANSGICPQPWSNGHFSWPIPAVWWVDGSSNTDSLQWSDQHFYIDSSGTVTIEKFGYTVTRETNNIYTVTQ